MDLELAVVVPTLNEAESIQGTLQALHSALAQYAYEIIIVDDSSEDNTAELVREIAKTDLRVRCMQRVGRRGRSGAALEGARDAFAARRVKHALEVYRFTEGRWPGALTALSERGILPGEELATGSGRLYYYARRSDGPVLLAPHR